MTINKNIRLILIVVVGVLISQAVAHYDEWLPHSWHTYNAPDSTFSLDLPGKPTAETVDTTDKSGNSIVVHMVSAEPTKETEYAVSYFDHPSDPADTPQETLEASLNGSLKKSQGNLIIQKNLVVQGYPAIDAQAHAEGNSLIDYRVILVKGRLFLLMGVATPEEDREPKTVQRFFNSFKVSQKPETF